MLDTSLIIKFLMFHTKQNIYIRDLSTPNQYKIFEVPTEEISEFIAKSNCTSVYLYGPESYCRMFEREVKTKFGKDNVLWYYNSKEKLNEMSKEHKEEE